jgi:hypothetical protein
MLSTVKHEGMNSMAIQHYLTYFPLKFIAKFLLKKQ